MILSGIQVLGGVRFNGDTPFDLSLIDLMAQYNLYFRGSLSTSEAPEAVSISADGNYLYTFDSGSNLRQYQLSTPFYPELGSTLLNTYSASGVVTSNGRGLYVKPDGTKFYIHGTANTERIFQYSMTDGNVASATYETKFFSVTSEDETPVGISISPDGQNLYMTGSISNRIYHYTLATPWEIDTATYTGNSISAGETQVVDVTVSPTGNSILLFESNQDKVIEHKLSSPFDISTYTSNSFIDMSGVVSICRGIHVSVDGKHLYLSSDNKVVHFTTGTEGNAYPILGITNKLNLPGGTYPRWMQFNNTGDKLFIGGSNDTLYRYTVNNYSIANITDDSYSFVLSGLSVLVEGTNSSYRSVVFNEDGTGFYTICGGTSAMYQFSLSTPYDLSTANCIGRARLSGTSTFKIAGTDAGTVGFYNELYLREDGSKIFFSVSNGTYGLITVGADLATPWDLNSIQDTSEFIDLAAPITERPPTMFFTRDGTKFYYNSYDTETLLEFALNDPWNLSSAQLTGKEYSLTYLDTVPMCCTYDYRSEKIYLLGGNQGTFVEFKLTES